MLAMDVIGWNGGFFVNELILCFQRKEPVEFALKEWNVAFDDTMYEVEWNKS